MAAHALAALPLSARASGKLPADTPSAAGTRKPEPVPRADFETLTRIPIIVYRGDNYPTEPTAERGQGNWRVRAVFKTKSAAKRVLPGTRQSPSEPGANR